MMQSEFTLLQVKLCSEICSILTLFYFALQIIFNVILTILTETLGEGFKPEIREAWEKLFNIIYNYLENSYKKIEAAS